MVDVEAGQLFLDGYTSPRYGSVTCANRWPWSLRRAIFPSTLADNFATATQT